MDELSQLSAVFCAELQWLNKIIVRCINIYYDKDSPLEYTNSEGKTSLDYSRVTKLKPVEEMGMNEFKRVDTNYTEFLAQHRLSFEERLLLVLALAIHIEPEFFTRTFKEEAAKFPQTGLQYGADFKLLYPTGLTFLFILQCGVWKSMSANTIERRLKAMSWLSRERTLFREQVISLGPPLAGSPVYSGRLLFSEPYIEWFTSSEKTQFKNTLT